MRGRSPPVRVLVFGGTRGVGRLVAERATEEGHQVTVFARHPDAVAWAQPPARLVRGDAREHEAVAAAVPGHDAVVMSLGPSGAERFQRFIGPATQRMVDAMERRGVRRLLLLSALGVGQSRRDAPAAFRWFVAPILLRTTFADRADAEDVVRRSRLDWTIVRPLWLTDGPRTGRWRATMEGREVRGGISRADVAEFVLAQLDRREFVGQAVAIETA